MNSARQGLLAALACLLATSLASAEVRLQPHGGSRPFELAIQVTRQGPWSPVGGVDSLVLNPGGDLLGDGFPRWAAEGHGVAAAWKRADDSAVLAIGTDAGWATSAVPAGLAGRAVQPLSVDGRWLLTWQADNLSVELWQGVDQPAEALTDGLLVDAVGGQETAQFLLVSDAGDLVLDTVVFAVILPHDILEPLARSRVALGPLAASPVGGVTGEAALAELAAQADVRIHELKSGAKVLTWWTPRGELASLELADDGPVLPVATLAPSGRASRPNGLVNRALKEVADRQER